jgi:glutamate--cysteine ligase
MPYGTSLRMGRLGYQSDAQSSLAVSYNSLDGYAGSLHEALTQPYPAYEKIGIVNPGGEYNQLATSLLQIENEFYGTIRPKRVIRPGERPLHALRERGVEYVEVRLMDLDPFVPIGIKAQTIRFLDIFLLHCLLADSPQDTPQEIAALGRNQHRTAAFGRDPTLLLERGDREVKLTDWGTEIVADCGPIAALLDEIHGTSDYGDALRSAEALLQNRRCCLRPACWRRWRASMATASRRSRARSPSSPSPRCSSCRGRADCRPRWRCWPASPWTTRRRSKRPTPCRSSNTGSSTSLLSA